TTDIEGKIVIINKVAEDLTGWSNEDARGKLAHEVFSIVNEKTGQKCASPVSRVLELGRIVGLANHTALITKNGTQVSIADSGAPIRDAESKTVGVVIVFRDITHERRIEEELLKTRKLESVGVLAGGIAHDFNNILAAVSGNIELASLRVEDDEATSLLSSAKKATRRATKLTQQLLTFSKGGDPVKEKTSLSGLIQESADFVLHGSKVGCEYNTPDDLWMVDADSGQLGQVIQNIIINAMQAMPEGGKIEINCSNIEDAAESFLNIHDGNFVCIRIQDTGIGIPKEIIDKIFDPYYSTKQQGSGLGLAICHSIINKHDGHISVQSNPGKGTTFTIYLPAVSPGETTAPKVPHTSSAVKAARIMVMDDEEMIRDLVKAQLTRLGHEAVLVADGEQAINEYQKLQDSGTPVDLVIMDLTIPGGMGGQEAGKRLLQVDPRAKIIVASGYSNDPVMAGYREYGFCAAVAKPFDLAELRKGIESALS
ncbi:MAG: ATP-binding protein, partial [Thermodesulfobacteriota bacterium]|nr:ATP-binding protein [Thermodesulfobacteriota bacterium]